MKVTERKWARPIMEENSILILVALRNFLLGLELLHYESTWCIYCTSSSFLLRDKLLSAPGVLAAPIMSHYLLTLGGTACALVGTALDK